MSTITAEPAVEQKIDLDEKQLTFKLSDLIREGARQVPNQAFSSWGDEESACALSAGVVAARNLGIIPA